MLFAFSGCSNDHNSRPEETGPPVLTDGDMASFTLLQTTDVHHRASGSGSSLTYSPKDGMDSSDGADKTQGGYARLTTKIAQARLAAASQNIPTLLVDSGDFLMGTVYDMTMGDAPAGFYFLEFMKYDAVTLGNHEFDYGPAGLAMILNNARGEDGSGFTVPIVASNMKTDGTANTDDDGLEAFIAAGAIVPTLVKTLDNGLKVGIMGLLGKNAENDAPLAGPVTFDHDYAAIQQTVDYLKNDLGAHIIVALSHSGVTDVDGTPVGDDIDLARNVTGIDIIATGHEHEMTPEIIMENGTRIICAGYYGKNLAQLDVTVTVGSGVTEAALTNHPIDDTTPGDPSMNFIVDMMDAGIDEALKPQLGIGINDVIAGSGSDNLESPYKTEETGMGNLLADSLRYMLGGMEGGIGIIASGVVREGFELGQQVTFADMYGVVPLGMTVDPSQQNVPGYPLMQVNLTGAHVKNMCQLAAYVIGAADEAFMAQLANPAHPYHALYFALVKLKSSYHLNLSGLRYTHAGAAGMYQIVPGSVTLYNRFDFSCQDQAAAIVNDAALYPCVMDIYMYFVMQSADLQMLLGALNLPIVPLNNSGQPVTMANMLDSRIDRDPATPGVQEVKEWMAFLTFLTGPPEITGFADHIIPEASYGQAALAAGNASRVNELSIP